MKYKFNLTQKSFLITPVLFLISGFLFNGIAFAEDGLEMLIDIRTDDVRIEHMDISNLNTGDVETIYSEDGKIIDVMKTADGVEIFIDGEKLDIPTLGLHSLHGDGHDAKHIMVKLLCECESGEDCAADEHWTIINGDDVQVDDAITHRIIVRKYLHSADEI